MNITKITLPEARRALVDYLTEVKALTEENIKLHAEVKTLRAQVDAARKLNARHEALMKLL